MASIARSVTATPSVGGLDLQVMIRFVDESLLTFTRTSFLLFGQSWFFRNNAETWNQRDG
jgi:hypothetical protein